MTLAIKYGSKDEPDKPSGFIYFDAVTGYTQEYRGQVTKHPVDRGASVTDHFIKENPIFNISGIITGMDISPIPSLIRDIEDNPPLNSQQQPDAIQVIDTNTGLLQFLPDSIGQFLNLGKPAIQADDTSLRVDNADLMKGLLIKLLDGVIYNQKKDRYDSFIQTLSLYEFDGKTLKNTTDDLVMTSFKISEDETTGDGLYFDTTLERVTFVTIKKAAVPAGLKVKKGKTDSTPKDASSTTDGTQPKAGTQPRSAIINLSSPNTP